MRDFNHSVNVLVRAFMNNTLEHTNCYACAVGNLVADANKLDYSKTGFNGGLVAHRRNEKRVFPMFWLNPIGAPGCIEEEFVTNDVLLECETTGYSVYELALIEKAFEGAEEGKSDDEWMFNGLMAVVDVLADIHGIDLTVREETKKLFVKS